MGETNGTKTGRFYRHCHREQGEASPRVNELLTEYGDIIVGRMGISYHERGVNVIALIAERSTNEIGILTGKPGGIGRVTVKSAMAKDRRRVHITPPRRLLPSRSHVLF